MGGSLTNQQYPFDENEDRYFLLLTFLYSPPMTYYSLLTTYQLLLTTLLLPTYYYSLLTTYQLLLTTLLLPTHQDPFAWRDARGFHALFHSTTWGDSRGTVFPVSSK